MPVRIHPTNLSLNLKRKRQMPNFIALYRSPRPAADMLKSVTPDQMQKGMKLWQTWVEKCGDALVEMGSPLGQGVSVGRAGNSPTPANNGVTVYSIIPVNTLDEAPTPRQSVTPLMTSTPCAPRPAYQPSHVLQLVDLSSSAKKHRSPCIPNQLECTR